MLKIGVLAGGPSSEHEVSLSSSENIISHLDKSKYKISAIKISKDNKWFLDGKLVDHDKALKNCDLVFNTLRGRFGEDGRIQALLEYYGKKYTGSGISASSLAKDKDQSRKIFNLVNIKTPTTMKIKKGESYEAQLNFFANKVIGFPVVVKPCSACSSLGVSLANNSLELKNSVDKALEHDDIVLVEKFIKGREFSCLIVDDLEQNQSRVLSVIEVLSNKNKAIFDHDSKFGKDRNAQLTLATLDQVDMDRVKTTSLKAHNIIGCRGYSKVDLILEEGSNNIFVLEVNSLPEISDKSLVAKSLEVVGVSMSNFLDQIIEISLA